jgi:CRISPR-associated endoribonuclease Cas6
LALEATPQLRIGRGSYRNVKATVQMSATYENLVVRTPVGTTWEFGIVTPSGFATAAVEGPRREIPWPEPGRVFASLARRWAYFAPAMRFPEGLDTVIHAGIEVTDFDLRLASYVVKSGEPPRRGAVGRVTYRLAGTQSLPASVISSVNALAGYAEYAGFGDRTAMGMGYVRLTDRTVQDE